jgi:hypothetical protein
MLLIAQTAMPIANCDLSVFNREQQAKRDELTEKVRELLNSSREITQRRLAISQRLIELSEGKHRFKGTFDPNYNADSLRARDRALADQLVLGRQKADLLQAESSLLTLERNSFHDRCGVAQ